MLKFTFYRSTLRFDLSRRVDDPSRFLLYEVYLDEADFKAHQQTDYFFRWRDTVCDWMVEPRKGHMHVSLHPADVEEEW